MANPTISCTSLYVGDLHPDVTEAILYDKFQAYGNVLSIRVCRDLVTRKSLGYAYVNYQTSNEAESAMKNLTFKYINGQPCKIMWSKRNHQILSQKLYPLISMVAGDMTNPIIEMILQLDNSEIHDLIENENLLRMKVEEILVLLNCDEGENEESEVINILLLGETGVGKSTWLNGLINYLTYPSLDDAAKGEPISLIRSKFTITNSNYESETVIYGNDDDTNEALGNIGHSVTQMPKSYTFNINNKRIRIIDTPGIGDTDSIEKDQLNMHNIVAYLSNFKDVNGIIVLLKPNEPRLNVMFKFCIQQLLLYLHKEACNNMVFCFTNCRSTFYKPGETLPVLKALFHKIKSIDIKLNKDTIYCMDNESIRFLMAMKTITFEDSEQIEYAASWKKAVEESTRLIQYISNLPPHSTQKTVSINEARRSIINQCRPIGHIAECIQNNINAIKSKQMEKISIESSKAQLHDQLKVKYSTLKIKQLDYPRTVCTAEKCVALVSNQIHYKTICHEHCKIKTDLNTIRCVALQKCWAMELGKSIEKCRKCSCSWEHHMHITYDVEEVIVEIEDKSIKKLIDGKDGNLKTNEDIQKRLQDKVDQYTKDKKRLIEINAYFACFLKHNAIIPYNDALIDYLDHLIKIKKVEADCNKDKIENLESLKDVYRQEIEVIEKVCGTNSDVGQNLDANKVEDLMSELKQLPSIREIFANGWSDIDKANYAAVKKNDKHIIVKPKGIMPKCVENLYYKMQRK